MRVLLTGMTAQQVAPASHRRAANFMGLIWDLLREGGHHEVDWREPSVTWSKKDIEEQYDHVFIGVASPLAMGASRAYGALSLMSELKYSKRVTYVVDAPDPDLITRGLRSVLTNPESLTKPFFSNRREYELSRRPAVNARLQEQVARLLTEDWPTTISPGMPWTNQNQLALELPRVRLGSLRTLNLDYQILGRPWPEVSPGTPQTPLAWAYERSPDRRWLPSLNLAVPTAELKGNHRIETDSVHAEQIRRSYGLLVGPHRGHTWWTPKAAMALAIGRPVFSASWDQARAYCPSWDAIPGPYELATQETRLELAKRQREELLAHIPTTNSEALAALYKAAGMSKRPNRKKALA